MRPKPPSQSGFTLLDSLIAVAILALALPLIFEAVRSAAWRMSSLERRETYWRAADALMTESVATLDGSLGVREGSTQDIAWRVETTRADEDRQGPSEVRSDTELVYVKVTVGARNRSRADAPVTLETLALAGPSR